MADSPYERGYQHGASGQPPGGSSGRSSSGGITGLTSKIGPLPVWGWLAVATILAVVWYLYQKNNATTSSGSGTSSDTTSSSLIPQFVNQTYTSVINPGSGASTSTATQPSSGTSSSGSTAPPTNTGTTSTNPTPPSAPLPTNTTVKEPATPSDASATATGPNAFKASWDAVPGATGYSYRITYQNKLVYQSPVTKSTSITHSGNITPDHTYTFHVKAIGPSGASPETNGPTFKTPKG